MIRTSCVLLAFVSTVAVGDPQPDKIFDKSSVTAQINRVLDIKATLPGNVSYIWTIPPDQEGIDFRSSGLNGYVFPRKVGSYWIGLAYGNPIQVAWLLVKVGDQITPPVQEIPPPSKPPTAGAMGPSWIVVVIPPKAVLPVLNSMFQYAPLVDEILNKGHAWKIIDSDGRDDRGNFVTEVAGAAAAAKGKTLPWVFIAEQDPKNFVIRVSVPLPTKPVDMLSLLK